MKKSDLMLGNMLGAVALAFTLALTGCGQAADTGAAETEEATEEVTEEATDEASDDAAEDEEFAGDLSDAILAPRTIMETEDELETVDLGTLPASEDNESAAEDKESVEEGLEDESKAPANTKLVTFGGMEVQIPSSWKGQKAGNAFVMLSLDGAVAGRIEAIAKKQGYAYDVTAMSAAIPTELQRQGYTDVKVTDYGAVQSARGTLCDSYVQVSFTANGMTCVAYFEYLESKSYVTYLGLSSGLQAWNKNAEDLASIVGSVCFAPGEMI